MEIEIQYFDDCPSWETAQANVASALAAIEPGGRVSLRKVESDHEAARLGFRGSPSILLGGRDLFPSPDLPVGMSCRVYRVNGRQEGSPSVDQLIDAIRSAAAAPAG